MADLARRETDGVARVEERTNEDAPPLLTTIEDMIDTIPGVVEVGVKATGEDGVSAIIVSAFSDPGLGRVARASRYPGVWDR